MGAHQALHITEQHLCLECNQKEWFPVIAENIDEPNAELSLQPYRGEAAEDGGDGSDAVHLEEACWEADEDWRPREPQEGDPSSEQRYLEEAAKELHLQQAIKMQDPGRVAALMALGQSRRARGDADGALRCIEMALLTHKSTSVGGLRLRLALLNSKGVLLHVKGPAELALETYRKAHSLCRTVGLVGSLQEAVLLLNMGMVHMLVGDCETAASQFSKALAVRDRHEAVCTPGGLMLLERIADLKQEMGDFNGAFDTYAAALGNCQVMGRLERLEGARLLSKMGTIDRMQRHFKAALQKYTHSSSILLRAKANNLVAFARVQGDIGIVRRELGELSAARQAFEEAVAIRLATDTLHSFEGMLLLMNMGTTLRLVEDFQGALDKYNQAREIRQRLGTSTPVPSDVHLLVQISHAAHKLDDQQWATESFLEAQRIRREIRMQQTPEGQRVLKTIGSGLVSAVSRDAHDMDAVETSDGNTTVADLRRKDAEGTSPASAATTATALSR